MVHHRFYCIVRLGLGKALALELGVQVYLRVELWDIEDTPPSRSLHRRYLGKFFGTLDKSGEQWPGRSNEDISLIQAKSNLWHGPAWSLGELGEDCGGLCQ
jgi:hypothetical protein